MEKKSSLGESILFSLWGEQELDPDDPFALGVSPPLFTAGGTPTTVEPPVPVSASEPARARAAPAVPSTTPATAAAYSGNVIALVRSPVMTLREVVHNAEPKQPIVDDDDDSEAVLVADNLEALGLDLLSAAFNDQTLTQSTVAAVTDSGGDSDEIRDSDEEEANKKRGYGAGHVATGRGASRWVCGLCVCFLVGCPLCGCVHVLQLVWQLPNWPLCQPWSILYVVVCCVCGLCACGRRVPSRAAMKKLHRGGGSNAAIAIPIGGAKDRKGKKNLREKERRLQV